MNSIKMNKLSFLLILGFLNFEQSDAAAGKKSDVQYLLMEPEKESPVIPNDRTFSKREPKCMNIGKTLHPCNKMEYTVMRLPNLLGQESLREVKIFLDSFAQENFLSCDEYAAFFMCSLVTPICFSEKPKMEVPPCRSLCERVKNKCIDQLDHYGMGIADEFNCSKFKDDNMCMDPSGENSFIFLPV